VTSKPNGSSVLNPEDVDRITSQFDRLRRKLPDEAVMRLAREVVARLSKQALGTQNRHSTEQDVEALAKALISQDPAESASVFERIRGSVSDVRVLYLDYLSAASRLLGEWWEKDEATFAEVTVGVARIFGIVRRLRPYFVPDVVRQNRTAVFAAVPGEDHTLGITLAADFFRKEGWVVDLRVSDDHDALLDRISASHPVLVGLSAGGEGALAELAQLVVAIRVSAPGTLVAIGGQLARIDPSLADAVGADLIVDEADHAVALVEAVLDELAPGESQR